jgi:hypothetical protein
MRDNRRIPIENWTEEELISEYRALDWNIYGIKISDNMDKLLYLIVGIELLKRGIDVLRLPHIINRISAADAEIERE